MAKNAATEQELAALHGALARQMAHMLTSGEPFPPAALSATRQFLKDNGIDCIGRSNPGLNDIYSQGLACVRAGRRGRGYLAEFVAEFVAIAGPLEGLRKNTYKKREGSMDNRKERAKYIATTLSNLGVIGLGLSLWQENSIWTGLIAVIFIVYGYIIIKRA